MAHCNGFPTDHKHEESSRFRRPMSPHDWSSALREIAFVVSKMGEGRIHPHVTGILEGIERLDERMTHYCALTCPSCADACCHGKKIFFNQADLIVITASGASPPPGQTRTEASAPCRYLGERGCLLSRKRRPYVCVWYLCEAQMLEFEKEAPRTQRDLLAAFTQIREHRLRLEAIHEDLNRSIPAGDMAL